MENKAKELKNFIEKSNRILLINHQKMDPDALWSVASLYYVLKKLWKEVKATNETIVPDNFSFLWVNEIFEINLDIKKFKPDLIITLDSWNLEQLWEVYTNNIESFDLTPIVVIDHHPTNTNYWTLNIVEPQISSTCELLYILLNKIWYWKYISTKEANLILAWIITDTNAFYNKNTTNHTMQVVSELLDLWVNMREILYNFFYKASYWKTKLKWILINKIEKSKNWKIVWSKLTKNDFKKTQTDENDTSWLIMNLLNIEWCELAFMLYQTNKWTKVSFRSNNFDVWTFCTKFPWWWWHKLAAWFRSEKSITELETEILKKLKKESI